MSLQLKVTPNNMVQTNTSCSSFQQSCLRCHYLGDASAGSLRKVHLKQETTGQRKHLGSHPAARPAVLTTRRGPTPPTHPISATDPQRTKGGEISTNRTTPCHSTHQQTRSQTRYPSNTPQNNTQKTIHWAMPLYGQAPQTKSMTQPRHTNA